jgi:PAS domain S-box-containing protein
MTGPATILAVDDTPESLALLVRTLTPLGYRVRPADSGELALAAAAAEVPDLILLDVRMKGIDGIEVCRRLKEGEATRDVPVLLISAFADVKDWVAGLQAGAADYISKPFQVEELLRRVKTHLALRKASDSLALQAAELRESEARFRTYVEAAPHAIIVLDGGGRILDCNPAGLEMLGLDAGTLKSMTIQQFLDAASQEAVPQAIAEILATGSHEREYRMARPDGVRVWVNLRATKLEEDRIMAFCVDISGRKAAEDELRESQAQLAIASRLASMGALVAGAAHEINNPLAAVLSGQTFARDVVQDVKKRIQDVAPLDREGVLRAFAEADEALADAQNGGRRVARIVKDMAAFARLDPGRDRVKLSDVVRESMRRLPSPVAEAAGIVVEDHPAPDVVASARDIGQVVENLVTNAARATRPGERGEIVIRTSTADSGSARLEVTDHGTGIDPGIRDRIFDPFFTTRPVGDGRGTGLGLAISHAIVTAHGGTLTFESQVGQGSTFRMDLPAASD